MAGRGGRRSGTPGKAYSNRTDLNVMRAPQQGTVTAAAGGQGAPAPQPQQQAPMVTPDMVPRLNDPGSGGMPLTDGLMSGPGRGPEALGAMPAPREVQTLQAAYLANPTPELRRALEFLSARGVL